MATIRVLRDTIGLDQKPLIAASFLPELGEWLLSVIRRRTEAGRDVNGAAFAPLSDGYAKQKQKALGHSRADLTVSGRMLNDMTARTLAYNTLEISFTSRGGSSVGATFIQRSRAVGAADKAYYHNESGAGRSRTVREFFAFSEQDLTDAARRVEAHLAAQLGV